MGWGRPAPLRCELNLLGRPCWAGWVNKELCIWAGTCQSGAARRGALDADPAQWQRKARRPLGCGALREERVHISPRLCRHLEFEKFVRNLIRGAA